MIPFPMHYHPIDWKNRRELWSADAILVADTREKNDEMIDEMQTLIGKCAIMIELTEESWHGYWNQ